MDAIPTIVCETLYAMGLHDQVFKYYIFNNNTMIKKPSFPHQSEHLDWLKSPG